jgi:broad specificity phosphatase PhoE
MPRYVELRRHTDNDGDVLTDKGVETALAIGARLDGGYHVGISSGAQRATQTLACFLAALGQPLPGGVVVDAGFRSEEEDRWRDACQQAGSGDLALIRKLVPDLVERETARMGDALRRAFGRLAEGGRALVVGHSPMNELAVLGLTGTVVTPLGKGDGVVVVAEGDRFRVEERQRSDSTRGES